MINDRTEFVFRVSILGMLSDDEVASVSTAETAMGLADGDEYLDMEQLDRGVQLADRKKTPMGRVLPKKSVHQVTWEKIIKQLPAPTVAKAHMS